jgi:hypothetical protein
MTNSLSQTMQTSKIELLEWLASEQDESFVQNIVHIVKNHSTWEKEILKSIERGKKDIAEGRVTSLEDSRKLAKTWGR